MPYDRNGAPSGGDAATLNSHAGDFYLDRPNHTGQQLASTIADFPEAVQDLVGAMLVSGANITVSYDDGTGAATIAVTGTLPAARMPAFGGDVSSVAGGVLLTLATVNLNVGAFGAADKAVTVTVNGKGLVTAVAETPIAILASQVTDFAEATDDRVASLLTAGSNVSLSYNDAGNALTVALVTSPALTGTPTAPTAANATSNTQIATTAFVHALVTDLINASPSTLDTLKELADAIGDDPNFAVTVAASIATKLAKASNLSDLTNAATARVNLGLEIGVNVQAYDALLQSIAGLTFGANSYIYGAGSDTAAVGVISAFGRDLVARANATDAWTALGTVPAANMPALTGDATTPGGSLAVTLATVNANVGTFGTATKVAQMTVDGKGRVTAVTEVTIAAVTSVTVNTANGVSATNTGTAFAPAFTFTLGAITPTSITASGTVTVSGDMSTMALQVRDTQAPATGNVTGGKLILNSPKPTAVNQRIGALVFSAFDSAAVEQISARIVARSSENWGTLAGEGTYLAFEVTAAGAFATTEVGQLTSAALTMTVPVVGTNITSAGNTTGNSATTTKLATGRTLAITGDLTWTSPSFDGSGNVTAAGTLATVNSNVGTFGTATKVAQVTVNAKGLVTAVSEVTVTPAVGSITGLGTGVGTFLATPSSANLLAAITDETGTGSLVFSASPTFTGTATVAALSATSTITTTAAWAAAPGIEIVDTTTPGASAGSGIRLRAAKPTAADQRVAMVFFGALDSSSAIQNSAAIQAYSQENWGTLAGEGTYLTFEVTAPAAFSRTVVGTLKTSSMAWAVPVSATACYVNCTSDPLVLNSKLGVDGGTGLAAGLKTSTSATEVAGIWNSATTGDNVLLKFYTDNGQGRGTISYNRGAGLVAYNTSSDYRSKEDLGALSGAEVGAVVDALRPFRGRMLGSAEARPMLIAHEVTEAGAPYAVTGEKDAVDAEGVPIFQQLDTSTLVPLLLAEVQFLRARVAALEAP